MMSHWLGAQQGQRDSRALIDAEVHAIGETIVDALRQSRTRRKLVGHKSIDPDDVARAIDNEPTLRTLAFVSRTVLDSELLIVTPTERSSKVVSRKRR